MNEAVAEGGSDEQPSQVSATAMAAIAGIQGRDMGTSSFSSRLDVSTAGKLRREAAVARISRPVNIPRRPLKGHRRQGLYHPGRKKEIPFMEAPALPGLASAAPGASQAAP